MTSNSQLKQRSTSAITFLASLWLCLVLSGSALGEKVYDIEALGQLVQNVKTYKGDKRPVVVLDLDDTLFNAAFRKLLVLRAFVSNPEIQKGHPDFSRKIKSLRVEHMKWDIKETLLSVGIDSPDFIEKAQAYWQEHFFKNDFVALDPLIAGAANYVRLLVQKNAFIIYFTGRNKAYAHNEGMELGTVKDIKDSNLPFEDGKTMLLMKPTFEMSDLEFKTKAFEQIAAVGEVLGIFENEPANINALKKRFPNAIAVLLDTAHSPGEVPLEKDVKIVPDFVCSSLLRHI